MAQVIRQTTNGSTCLIPGRSPGCSTTWSVGEPHCLFGVRLLRVATRDSRAPSKTKMNQQIRFRSFGFFHDCVNVDFLCDLRIIFWPPE